MVFRAIFGKELLQLLSKSSSFLLRFVGAFLVLLLLLSHFLLVLRCAINNCLLLLFYCSRSCFALWMPDSILTYCRRALPRVQWSLSGEAVSRGHAVCGLWSQPETVHLPVPTRKAWRVFRCMSQTKRGIYLDNKVLPFSFCRQRCQWSQQKMYCLTHLSMGTWSVCL